MKRSGEKRSGHEQDKQVRGDMPAWLAEEQPAKRQKFCILCLEKIFTENNGVEKNRAVQNSILETVETKNEK